MLNGIKPLEAFAATDDMNLLRAVKSAIYAILDGCDCARMLCYIKSALFLQSPQLVGHPIPKPWALIWKFGVGLWKLVPFQSNKNL